MSNEKFAKCFIHYKTKVRFLQKKSIFCNTN